MVYIQKKKDILWGGATASSQYEGGYDLDDLAAMGVSSVPQ